MESVRGPLRLSPIQPRVCHHSCRSQLGRHLYSYEEWRFHPLGEWILAATPSVVPVDCEIQGIMPFSTDFSRFKLTGLPASPNQPKKPRCIATRLRARSIVYLE